MLSEERLNELLSECDESATPVIKDGDEVKALLTELRRYRDEARAAAPLRLLYAMNTTGITLCSAVTAAIVNLKHGASVGQMRVVLQQLQREVQAHHGTVGSALGLLAAVVSELDLRLDGVE